MVKKCNKSVRHLRWALHGSWVHKMDILIHLWCQVSAFKTFSESLCVDHGDALKVWWEWWAVVLQSQFTKYPSIPFPAHPPLLRSQLVGMDVKALSYEGFSGVAVGWRMEQHGSVGTGVRVQGWASVGVSRLGQKGPGVICGQGRHSLESWQRRKRESVNESQYNRYISPLQSIVLVA